VDVGKVTVNWNVYRGEHLPKRCLYLLLRKTPVDLSRPNAAPWDGVLNHRVIAAVGDQ